jgi:hypothetical protein
VDNDDAAQERHLDAAIASQRTLMGMSDHPGQFRQDPMMAMINQAHRAQSGEDEGMNYLTMPF